MIFAGASITHPRQCDLTIKAYSVSNPSSAELRKNLIGWFASEFAEIRPMSLI